MLKLLAGEMQLHGAIAAATLLCQDDEGEMQGVRLAGIDRVQEGTKAVEDLREYGLSGKGQSV